MRNELAVKGMAERRIALWVMIQERLEAEERLMETRPVQMVCASDVRESRAA